MELLRTRPLPQARIYPKEGTRPPVDTCVQLEYYWRRVGRAGSGINDEAWRRLDETQQRGQGTGRVVFLWLLVLLLFAGFNGVFWPIHFRQIELAPENFLAHAQKLHDRGESSAAIAYVRSGIGAHHPPGPEPYAALRDWLRGQGEEAAAQGHEPAVRFYSAMRSGIAERTRLLFDAVEAAMAVRPMPHVAPQTRHYVDRLAGNFGAAYGVLEVQSAMTPQQQLALLWLTGGALLTDGMIGATGIQSPEDILVQSGGGGGARRHAHIFLRGRDYASRKRGFHAALINAETGQVIQSGVFDIWDRVDEAGRMAEFLRAAQAGCIGAFAVFDDASANLTAELEDELLGFGLERQACIERAPALLGLSYSFAAIGVKGAGPGTALQAWSPENFKGQPGHPVVCGVVRPAGDAP